MNLAPYFKTVNLKKKRLNLDKTYVTATRAILPKTKLKHISISVTKVCTLSSTKH